MGTRLSRVADAQKDTPGTHVPACRGNMSFWVRCLSSPRRTPPAAPGQSPFYPGPLSPAEALPRQHEPLCSPVGSSNAFDNPSPRPR